MDTCQNFKPAEPKSVWKQKIPILTVSALYIQTSCRDTQKAPPQPPAAIAGTRLQIPKFPYNVWLFRDVLLRLLRVGAPLKITFHD